MGQRKTMTVIEVKENQLVKANKNIHHIKFENPTGGVYFAEEPSELSVSHFKVGMQATFEVVAEGKANNKDWIKYIGEGGKAVIHRDNLEVAKVGFSCAVQVGLREGWDESRILQAAEDYAQKILIIATTL